jgi:hypothetical protein
VALIVWMNTFENIMIESLFGVNNSGGSDT